MQTQPLHVRDVMTHGVEVISPDAPLAEAAAKMRNLDIGPLPVVEGGRLVGMITDRDITVRSIAEGADPTKVRVRDAMTPHMVACYEDQTIDEAATLMETNQIRRVVVLNRDGQLVGIVSLGDLSVRTGDEELAGEVVELVSEPSTTSGPRATPVGDVVTARGAGKTVAGVFADRYEAQRALEDLRAAGVDPRQVSVITRDPEHAREIVHDTGAEAVGGAATGAGVGAILGGAAGWLIGIGALAIPGIGPVIAAGPIAAALGVAGATAAVGAGAGAVGGGLVGALTGWGFAENEAREYESRVMRGDILLVVEVAGDLAERAEHILRQDGADGIRSQRAA
jgi:CBS domain-containing protein